ncbi:hypothetical protein [Vulgatibacter incomptus]|uniref:hypothetical protein n=1 Tax=Vulgatibacter incomptus TaxID=1391653 RepID=UPI000681B2B2|nr:hypothetical protein [Vulgatibacter incomptus]
MPLEPICDDGRCVWPIAMPGRSVTIFGSISAENRWQGRQDNCSNRGGTPFYFDTVPIMNNTGAPQKIRISARFPSSISSEENFPPGTVFLFDYPFNPANTGPGCRMGASAAGLRAALETTLQAGEKIEVVVASQFSHHVGEIRVDVQTAGGECHPIVCDDGIMDFPANCDDFGMSNVADYSTICPIGPIIPASGSDSMYSGYRVPMGSWIQSQGVFLEYTFPVEPGVTYEFEVFSGAPFTCANPGAPQRLRIDLLGSSSSTYFTPHRTYDSDYFSGIGGCPRLVWTAPDITTGFNGENMKVLVWNFGSATPPLFVSIREAR